jgi:hypothetical protein
MRIAVPAGLPTAQGRGSTVATVAAAAAESECLVPDSPVDEGMCAACGSGQAPHTILLCDECNAGFHYDTCLDPPLRLSDIPAGEWFCPTCDGAPRPIFVSGAMFWMRHF